MRSSRHILASSVKLLAVRHAACAVRNGDDPAMAGAGDDRGAAAGDGGPELVPATRPQKALAGAVDTAFALALVGVSWWSHNGGAGRRELADRMGRLVALTPLKGIVDEQLGTPGAWVAGIRTVDQRTGKRVALWRTVLIVSARMGMRAAAQRLTKPSPPISEAEQEQRARELQAIRERFADDEDARNAALMDHYREHQLPVQANFARPLAITLGSAVVNNRLRRHLAPTKLVGRRAGVTARRSGRSRRA
jgi:hypothetical protein